MWLSALLSSYTIIYSLCTSGGESTGSGSTVQAGQRTSREQEEGPQQPSTQGGRGDSSDGVTGEEEGGSGGSQEEGSGSYEGNCQVISTFRSMSLS